MSVNSLHWYYVPGLGNPGEQTRLEEDEWHHCFNVRRMREGDSIILCDGLGGCTLGTISHATAKKNLIEIGNDVSDVFKNHRPYRISIGIAPTKNIERIEFAVEKLVELGIDEIGFLQCQYSERTHLRMDRIQKIIVSASKQSRKINFPKLHPLVSPVNFVSHHKKQNADMQLLACHINDSTTSIAENYLPGNNVLLMIGPEGGFSNEEIEMLKHEQFNLVHLGPFRLRVETAAITSCVSIHVLNDRNKL